jgi:hypothetical protein
MDRARNYEMNKKEIMAKIEMKRKEDKDQLKEHMKTNIKGVYTHRINDAVSAQELKMAA